MKKRLIGLFFCAATMASAQAPLWLVSCNNQNDPARLMCEVAQSIVLSEGNQRVATAAFVKPAGDAEHTAVFTLPVGLYLPAGLKLSVDDQDLGELAFQSCDAQGCYATGAAGETWPVTMAEGEELKITIQRQDRQTVNFSFPLEGFRESIDIMP
ncbi:invasion protein IalB [Primorskyibacter sedentarius]|uniref:Invasion protein IalB n=1 Tax=Primorskyibacter sedentarius TaxID=745311 RepID=A0A4R3J6N2_9RHOB|nr:invasion associated locus B family protein [Primorskyibacter sedentarius]TCS61498.1 invasion protein IalB [Primorskyibacter sedentarius]